MRCQIINQLFSMMQTLAEREKTPRQYGDGLALYHAEVNFLEAVFRHPQANALALSKIMRITPGAVTQVGNRLVEKGLLQKESRHGNKKEKYYALTQGGEAVRQGHIAHHFQANREICAYLSTLQQQEIDVITAFLQTASQLPISEFDCMENTCCMAGGKEREHHPC